MKDRRYSARYIMVMPIEYQTYSSPNFLKSKTIDISENGISFFASYGISAGAKIQIKMFLNKEFIVETRVAHSDWDQKTSLYRTGVNFEKKNVDFKENLSSRIHLFNIARRRFDKHVIASPLHYEIVDNPSKIDLNTFYSSEGGLLFASKHEVFPDEIIILKIPLYDKNFEIRAKVIYTAKSPEPEIDQFKVAVVFCSPSDAFRIKLVEQICLIEEYRIYRSLALTREILLQDASNEWIARYSEKFKKMYW
ncbi:type IV pilus assembly PilZ [Candidatus Omnitrophus magneticus]|uniref:Type IV pilus assembly PilZ n=1 Tax=Candidatus Omnitrophus magneticus TaxID=1609969 RepID=A0A0F0CS41_9BACT|nr:type IV pilus assembly PilZ [Candidatus Omnitrophus magneticus]